jgi:hypothetical protein
VSGKVGDVAESGGVKLSNENFFGGNGGGHRRSDFLNLNLGIKIFYLISGMKFSAK